MKLDVIVGWYLDHSYVIFFKNLPTLSCLPKCSSHKSSFISRLLCLFIHNTKWFVIFIIINFCFVMALIMMNECAVLEICQIFAFMTVISSAKNLWKSSNTHTVDQCERMIDGEYRCGTLLYWWFSCLCFACSCLFW